jgi:hypothetical protein
MERNDKLVTSETREERDRRLGRPTLPTNEQAMAYAEQAAQDEDEEVAQDRREAQARTKNGGYEESGEGLLTDPDN